MIRRTNITTIEELATFLELPVAAFGKPESFQVNVPRRIAEKIERGNIEDPLLRQFVPLTEEQETLPTFGPDPVSETQFRANERVLKKYPGRALIITSAACAMHCRYCFRKEFSYPKRGAPLQLAVDEIKADPTIKEAILSGGDPLSLPNAQLKMLVEQIDAIPHITKIRFHTRYPIGIPERIDRDFLTILEQCKAQVWFLIHCNHPRELDDDIIHALQHIQRLGIPVINQAVLLKGVNDSVETLKGLAEALIDHGIGFYYLHQLDKVVGAHHFEVPVEKGLELVEKLREELPGYAVPTYVQEVPGKQSKTPLHSFNSSQPTKTQTNF